MTEKKKIQSVEDYITEIKLIFKSLQKHDEVCEIWFRGEEKNDILTPLLPKSYRLFNDPEQQGAYDEAKKIEGNLKAQFSRQTLPYLTSKGIPKSEWNDYFLMQHYGLQTRLLDWSESALISLFFAIESLSKTDSRIWILNPHRLNKFTTSQLHPEKKGISGLICPTDCKKTSLFDERNYWNITELERKYLKMDFDLENEKNPSFYPLAIMPSFLDERMSMQFSCFTIFGNVVNGLIEAKSNTKFLDSLVVDCNYKRRIKEELRWLGISQRNIYPDLEGVSKSIADRYNNDHLIFKRIQ